MMAATERPLLTGARFSNASRCPRMAAYDVLGAFPLPPSERVEGLFQRGHEVEDGWFDHILPKTYSGRVQRQAAIPWGTGWEAHVDGILLDDPQRTHVEVKSTTDIHTLPGVPVEIRGVKTTAAVIQVVGGAIFDPDGGDAAVVAVSPVDYQDKWYPINITPELRGVVEEVADRVVEAARTGDLPSRVCLRPSDAIGRHCPYAADCFADYDEPIPTDLTENADARDAAEELLKVTLALRQNDAATATLKKTRDELRGELVEAGVEAGVDYQIGDTRVKLTAVKGRETFDYRGAIASGQLEMTEPLTTYLKTGKPSERWTVE